MHQVDIPTNRQASYTVITTQKIVDHEIDVADAHFVFEKLHAGLGTGNIPELLVIFEEIQTIIEDKRGDFDER